VSHEISSRHRGLRAPPWLTALLVLGAIVGTVLTLRSLPDTTVILVRHAEKQSGSADPPLTPEGAERAERLATMLAENGGATPIARIFSSEVRRTQETAAPLARKLALAVTTVPARETAALVSQLRAAPRGSVSVVVGHSNTVPRIVAALTGGPAVPDIAEDDFGTIFVVRVAALGAPSVVRLRY
jgi:phosphohistidine phosphatase SixA